MGLFGICEGFSGKRSAGGLCRANWADSTSSLGEESGLGAQLRAVVLLEPAPKSANELRFGNGFRNGARNGA